MNSLQGGERTGFVTSHGSHDPQMPNSTQSNILKQGINSSINNPLKLNDSKSNLVHKSFMNAQMNIGSSENAEMTGVVSGDHTLQTNSITPTIESTVASKQEGINQINKLVANSKLHSRQIGSRFSQPSVQCMTGNNLGPLVTNNTQKPSSVDRS